MNVRLSVAPSAKDPFTVTAKIVGYDGQATLHWGDGSTPLHMMPHRTYQHTYPAIGGYMVTSVDGNGVLIARQQISVTGSVELDEVRVSEDDGGLRVHFDDADPRLGVSRYRIEWQDGDTEHVWGVPGHVVRHDAATGSHEIKIVNTASGRTQRYQVRVVDGPAYDPDFTVHRATEDTSGMSVYVRLTRVQAQQPVHIWWDDADGPQLVDNPMPGMEVPHIYTFPGHYMQTVAYAGSTSFARAKSEAMTVPDTESRGWRSLARKAAPWTPEAPLSALDWAHRRARRGFAGHSVWPALRAGRTPVSGSALAIEGATGVEEPGADDADGEPDPVFPYDPDQDQDQDLTGPIYGGPHPGTGY